MQISLRNGVVDIIDAMLPSRHEAVSLGQYAGIGQAYWTRTSASEDTISVVNADGNLSELEVYHKCGVRPMLLFTAPCGTVNIGDKFLLADKVFVVISDNTAVCEESIGISYFRIHWKENDAISYLSSDARISVELWFDSVQKYYSNEEDEE